MTASARRFRPPRSASCFSAAASLARKWSSSCSALAPRADLKRVREEAAAHPIEAAGRTVRAMLERPATSIG
jgi:ketol-acid reductoisomerase